MNTEKTLDIVLKEATSIVAQRNAELMKSISTEGISFSENFKERMNALFERARVIERRLLIRKRIAVAIIAALIAALTACASVPTIRERLYKTIITHYDRFFRIEYVPENDDGYERPQFVAKAPTYVPEGYELKQSRTDGGSADYYYEKYDSESDFFGYIAFSQDSINNPRSETVDNEDVIIHNVKIGELDAMVLEITDYEYPAHLVLWNDNYYIYRLFVCGTFEDAVKMAESVR